MGALEGMKSTAAEAIRKASDELRGLSLSIHERPELNFKEQHAHGLLTDYLEEKGFHVERGAYGMPTAFAAVTGSGAPTIAVLCEYDALPEIGHACGHNLIAISGVAAGLGVKAGLGEGHGTLMVLGSPAEEGGGGKVVMIDRGAFEGVDAAMMLHPTQGHGAWPNVIAIASLEVEFFGRNAHASASPWEGVNALDAMLLAFNGISMLRQQMRPTDRVHGVISKGGVKPNIIPDHTAAEFYIRARTLEEVERLRERVLACFEGAAKATGCRLEHSAHHPPYTDLRTNDVLANAYVTNMAQLGLALPTKEQMRLAPAASTDMGNVSYVVPSIHPFFGIPSAAGNHTPGFTEAAATPEAHESALQAATAMAWTALDAFLTPGMVEAATKEFRERVKR